jgi:hypothetical protein
MSSEEQPDVTENNEPGPITITVKPLGTIVIHGPARIEDLEGNLLTIPTFKQPGVIKLCGCGRSGNKPFCDGSHKKPRDD